MKKTSWIYLLPEVLMLVGLIILAAAEFMIAFAPIYFSYIYVFMGMGIFASGVIITLLIAIFGKA